MSHLVVKFLLVATLVDLIIDDSALLLYFSGCRQRTRCQKNHTEVPIFWNMSLPMSVFYCKDESMF